MHVWHPSVPVAPSEYPVLHDNIHSTVDMHDFVGAGFGASVGASIYKIECKSTIFYIIKATKRCCISLHSCKYHQIFRKKTPNIPETQLEYYSRDTDFPERQVSQTYLGDR